MTGTFTIEFRSGVSKDLKKGNRSEFTLKSGLLVLF